MKVITIGRGYDNDVVINENKVSHHHAQIISDGGTYRIVDFNSTNGTYVNGMRIYGEMRILPNDDIRLGDTVLPWLNYFGRNNVNETQYSPPAQIPAAQNIIIQQPLTASNSTNGLGIAGFILSLIALVFCWLPFINLLSWLLGLILSICGMNKKPRGLAIAGMIISIIELVLFIILLIILMAIFENEPSLSDFWDIWNFLDSLD
jgi:hypothetical protein